MSKFVFIQANSLNRIHHKNIVTLIGIVYEPPTNFCFIMGKCACAFALNRQNLSDLCDKGSLFDYIHDKDNPLDLALALRFAREINAGISVLHNT